MKRRGGNVLALVLLAAMLLAVTPALAKSRQAVVKTRSATVYQKPKATSNVLGVLGKGAQVTVTAINGKIVRIQYAGGSGYVKKSDLELQAQARASATPVPASETAASSDTVKKTLRKSVAYLRPSVDCDQKTAVRKGTRFVILGVQGDFYKVKRSGQAAYILQEAFREPAAPTPTPLPTPSPTPELERRTVRSDAMLYSRASRSAKVLATVKAGATVRVARAGVRFVQAYYANMAGYLPLSAFEETQPAAPAPAPTATPAPAKARQADSSKADKVVAAALAQLGKPYVYGATGTSAFDCSGLTRYAYGQAGVSLPHSAYSVGYGVGTKVTRAQLQRGDIVCFNTIADGDLCDHVGVYMGDGKFVHASSGQGRVVTSSLSGYYSDNFSWGRRVL